MARDGMEIIQVCFNVLDPDQRRLFEHAIKRSNRSGYVKRLIQRDMDAAVAGYVRAAPSPPAEVELDFAAEAFI